ncbi:hypothetical protein ABPG72_005361 [Tetrahymena utriculariae]
MEEGSLLPKKTSESVTDSSLQNDIELSPALKVHSIKKKKKHRITPKRVICLLSNYKQAEGLFFAKSSCLILAAFKGTQNITQAIQQLHASCGSQKVVITNTQENKEGEALLPVFLLYKARNSMEIRSVVLTEPDEEFLLE